MPGPPVGPGLNCARAKRSMTYGWRSGCAHMGSNPGRFGSIGTQAKGYLEEDCLDVFRRYIPRSELDALIAESSPAEASAGEIGKNGVPETEP